MKDLYKILYIGGGFDILHHDHRSFILKGVETFLKKYGELEKIIVGLKPDSVLNAKKGILRPYFSFEWRREDISDFLVQNKLKHEVIKTNQFATKFRNSKDIIAQVRSDYPQGAEIIRNLGVAVEIIKPFDTRNTTTTEKTLLSARNKSKCNLRKVGALLIRAGEIISEGSSGSGNCNCCSKYLAYQKGGGRLSKKTKCDFPHAEAIALQKARRGDDLLITDSPCAECAELIVGRGIRRVVYLQEYHDLKPVKFLQKSGIAIRKSGQ